MKELIDNTKPPCPCKNCDASVKFLGCHSVCPDYIEYKEKSQIIKAQIHKKKSETRDYDVHRKEMFQKHKYGKRV